MANENIKQVMQDAILDADSLEQFVNGSEVETVLTRLSAEYPTLQKALKELFENGGIADRFERLDDLEASSLPNNSYALVADDEGSKNGIYIKKNGKWVKSGYDLFAEHSFMTRSKKDTFWETIPGTPDRLRTTLFTRFTGLIEVEVLDSDYAVRLAVHTEDGKIDGYTSSFYAGYTRGFVDGGYTVFIQKADDVEDKTLDINNIDNKVRIKLNSLEAIADDLDIHVQYSESIEAGQLDTIWQLGGLSTWPHKSGASIKGGHVRLLNTTLIVECNNPKYTCAVEVLDKNKKRQYTRAMSLRHVENISNGFIQVYVKRADEDGADVILEEVAEALTIRTITDSTKLRDFVFDGVVPVQCVNGTYLTTTARPTTSKTRVRPTPIKIKHTGYLSLEAAHPEQSVSLFYFDKKGNYEGWDGEYSKKATAYVDGYISFLAKWDDDRNISKDEVDIRLILDTALNPLDVPNNSPVVPTPDQDQGSHLDWVEGIPKFSKLPLGHLVTAEYSEKQAAFDEIVSRYPYESAKELIGVSTSDSLPIHGYTLTPNDYEVTIAITCHVHGNEPFCPIGFFALLDMFGKAGKKHEFILWLRDKVRWLVVPFVSPESIISYARYTSNVNINRNFDFLWHEGTDRIGSKPFELNESQAIVDFVSPYLPYIDFHLDLHDFRVGNLTKIGYNPFHPEEFLWSKGFIEMKSYLADINNTGARGVYASSGGSATNYFANVLGVPSLTPEHVTPHWEGKGLSIEQQMAKCTEQICAFLYLFKHYYDSNKPTFGSMYNRLHDTGFGSTEHGASSWSKTEIIQKFELLPNLEVADGFDNVFVQNGSLESTKTILVVSGLSDDDNNSALTVYRALQRVNDGVEMYLENLQSCRLVVVPCVLSNHATEEDFRGTLSQLLSTYNPDYTLLVRAPRLAGDIGDSVVRSSNDVNLTTYSKQADVLRNNDIVGIESEISTRYSVIELGNDVLRHAVFGFSAARWIKMVVNDIASFFATDYNDG